MAGMGSRFTEAGYTDIKPLIPIHGKPMVGHVLESVGIDGNWVFIVQKHHRELHNLDSILSALRPGCIIIDTAGGVTEGAACSVLLAKNYIDNDNPLIVINSDNIIKWNQDNFYNALIDRNRDGLILCFSDTDPKWSYAKVDQHTNLVVEVAEKMPISNNATAGMYIWRRGKDFVSAAEQMIDKNIRTNNEFYLCPVYNENISMGHNIEICNVTEMHGVGTPADLIRYINK